MNTNEKTAGDVGLTDERIDALWRDLGFHGSQVPANFARAIAREVLATRAPADLSGLTEAWEYSFAHSSSLGKGDTEVGPCLTYDKSAAFGVGCFNQRRVYVASEPLATTSAAAVGEPDQIKQDVSKGVYYCPCCDKDIAGEHSVDGFGNHTCGHHPFWTTSVEAGRAEWNGDAAPVPPVSAAEEPKPRTLSVDDGHFSMTQVVAIRDTIKPGDGWGGDEWDFALANAVAAHLARQAQAAPTYRKATDELSLPELAEQFHAVASLGGEYTLSSKVCGKLYDAMTTPPSTLALGSVPQAERAGVLDVIHLRTVGTLRREDRTGGGYGWLMYDGADKLLRALNGFEGMLVDSALDAAPVAQEVEQMGGAQAAPTDLSKRLRAIAAGVKPNDPALVTPQCLTDAADEIERYYGAMLAWKRTAEAKDREFAAASYESVDTPELDSLLDDCVHTEGPVAKQRLIAHITSLIEARVAGVRKDAERYRWLRFADLDALAAANWGNGGEVYEGEKFDAAIDAAMSASPASGSQPAVKREMICETCGVDRLNAYCPNEVCNFVGVASGGQPGGAA